MDRFLQGAFVKYIAVYVGGGEEADLSAALLTNYVSSFGGNDVFGAGWKRTGNGKCRDKCKSGETSAD
jgi:hypothetical protein